MEKFKNEKKIEQAYAAMINTSKNTIMNNDTKIKELEEEIKAQNKLLEKLNIKPSKASDKNGKEKFSKIEPSGFDYLDRIAELGNINRAQNMYITELNNAIKENNQKIEELKGKIKDTNFYQSIMPNLSKLNDRAEPISQNYFCICSSNIPFCNSKWNDIQPIKDALNCNVGRFDNECAYSCFVDFLEQKNNNPRFMQDALHLINSFKNMGAIPFCDNTDKRDDKFNNDQK